MENEVVRASQSEVSQNRSNAFGKCGDGWGQYIRSSTARYGLAFDAGDYYRIRKKQADNLTLLSWCSKVIVSRTAWLSVRRLYVCSYASALNIMQLPYADAEKCSQYCSQLKAVRGLASSVSIEQAFTVCVQACYA